MYRKEKENKMKIVSTQYTCPDCGFKTKFAHHNTSMAELRKHRALERAIALHPAGKKLEKVS
jgi:ribosomal protein S27AE